METANGICNKSAHLRRVRKQIRVASIISRIILIGNTAPLRETRNAPFTEDGVLRFFLPFAPLLLPNDQ